jgi:asparagine synthase (glutamine-hydrolysing)
MCGIFGVADVDGVRDDIEVLRTARDLLSHRGPDSAGESLEPDVYFGFRRLAILDVSEQGHQPMSTPDGGLTIVFNGEIYNFLELRRELEATGVTFRSQSDTEVLLRMFERHGVDMLARLNGMFAMAIHDRRRRRIVFARDRLGKKPLFYFHRPGRIAWSSETKALRLLEDCPDEIDTTAAGLYLRVGFVPGWTSIYHGIRKLPPATWVSFDLDRGVLGSPTRYWSLPSPLEVGGVSEAEWLDRVDELIQDATRIRLRSDVPVGVFLSSGIDSGLVAAAAAAQQRIRSLTIGFPGHEEDEWSEARLTASHLQVDAIHEALTSSSMHLLPRVMAHFDEPFADSSALPTYMICKKAKDHVTVALSGDGGDEVFAGYDNHLRAYRWRFLESLPYSLRRIVARSLLPCSRGDSRRARFLKRLQYPIGSLGIGGKIYPFEDWLSDLVRPEFQLTDRQTAEAVLANIPDEKGASALDSAQRCDLGLYMVDDILVKVDRMSMLASLEVRSPLLDYRIVELALSVPSELRTRAGRSKYLLRRLAERYLPRRAAVAAKKGFGLPLADAVTVHGDPGTRHPYDLLCQDQRPLDPLVPGGFERLAALTAAKPILRPALFRTMSFYWWAAGQATAMPVPV